MKPAPFNLLLETVSRDNILVLTTSCSTACIFCSHLQNPAGIDAYYVDRLSREQIDTLVEFLDEKRKIVIGESATRICEGEPFLREDIIDILKSIRLKCANTPIQITTSGIHLNEAVLSELREIGNIELNVSLNSCSEQGRKKLFRGKTHLEAVAAVKQLKNYGIRYSGSIVAMPHLVGWEDIRETVMFLSCNDASLIRIFMPGYTRYSKGILPPEDIRDSLSSFTAELGKSIEVPIVMEPSGINDLNAEVIGVLKGSPAWESGIARGDRILDVNGKNVVSRVDAYYKILKAGNPEIKVLRGGECREIAVNKKAKAPSGMVFDYDIHPDEIEDIEKAIQRNRGSSCLILTSDLAYGILTGCIAQNEKVKIESVKNRYFGGNIMCAGLLTISDIEMHLAERGKKPEVLLLPGIMFDTAGRDLLGRQFEEVEEGLEIKVEVV
jgi:MoaA/NifB/PqqE/SkfB family radical SAM enzyme